MTTNDNSTGAQRTPNKRVRRLAAKRALVLTTQLLEMLSSLREARIELTQDAATEAALDRCDSIEQMMVVIHRQMDEDRFLSQLIEIVQVIKARTPA